MVTINEFDYKRVITHTHYKHGSKKTKKGRWSRMLPLHITHNKVAVNKNEVNEKEAFLHANDNFLSVFTDSKGTPLWGGGLFLILFVSFLVTYMTSDEKSIGAVIAIFLFFLIYYFKMPKKEFIFNRKDGTVTFPGFMWKGNVTMPVKSVIFSMSSPSPQGGGAYLLQIVRPDKTYSLYLCTLGNICYEDLSFFLWYMDKNRPLPPGTGFDQYREKDFQRRKAAGFPKPVFESEFDTPEATPEQQAERKRIGGW